MTDINRNVPVLITGATGYVAGWLVKRLLEEGLTVHAAVRDPSNENKLKHLNAMAENSDGSIKYFKSDLLSEGSYAEAMEGCELVFHTASPFTSKIKDPVKDLIEPAVIGTKNVLDQANDTKSVKKIVITSSVAAIYGDNADMSATTKGIFTEADWNVTSDKTHQAYSYSKTLAETAAWELHKMQDRWDMVTVNPSLVVGPGTNSEITSESFSIVKKLGDGTLKGGVPHWELGLVDVRDLAEAHFQAGFKPDVKGRHIISGHNSSLFEMAQILRDNYGDKYPFPKKIMPKPLVWLFGPMMDKNLTRKSVSRNIGHPLRFDNSKSMSELGITYRPLKESMVDFFQQMIDNGQIAK